jgi:phosphate transport system substrate-binding protein
MLRSFFAAILLLTVPYGTALAQEQTDIHVDGSYAFDGLLGDMASSYRETNPAIAVTVSARGYREAVKALTLGSVDVAVLDRTTPVPDQVDHLMAVVPYAIVIDPSVGVKSLTSAQIAGIFSGVTKNWSQIGGSDTPIIVVNRPAGSGTTAFFASVFGPNSAKGIVVDNTSAAVAVAVRATKGAVGYVGLPFTSTDGLVVAAIDGEMPTAEAVASRQYRFYSYVHAVTQGPPSTAVSRFLSFAQTRRETLHRAGYFTVSETSTK